MFCFFVIYYNDISVAFLIYAGVKGQRFCIASEGNRVVLQLDPVAELVVCPPCDIRAGHVCRTLVNNDVDGVNVTAFNPYILLSLYLHRSSVDAKLDFCLGYRLAWHHDDVSPLRLRRNRKRLNRWTDRHSDILVIRNPCINGIEHRLAGDTLSAD